MRRISFWSPSGTSRLDLRWTPDTTQFKAFAHLHGGIQESAIHGENLFADEVLQLRLRMRAMMGKRERRPSCRVGSPPWAASKCGRSSPAALSRACKSLRLVLRADLAHPEDVRLNVQDELEHSGDLLFRLADALRALPSDGALHLEVVLQVVGAEGDLPGPILRAEQCSTEDCDNGEEEKRKRFMLRGNMKRRGIGKTENCRNFGHGRNALLLRLLGRGVDRVILGTRSSLFELFTGLLELTHALAQAAGKGGELLGAEEHEDKDGDDHHFPSAKGENKGGLFIRVWIRLLTRGCNGNFSSSHHFRRG